MVISFIGGQTLEYTETTTDMYSYLVDVDSTVIGHSYSH
jgi:hypothetical protein